MNTKVFPAARVVVVGVNGSPNSLAALRRAAQEAHERRARLDVIQVVDERRGPGAWFTAWLRLRSLAADVLPVAWQPTARLHVTHGDPATVLVEASRHADLLVVGCREHSEHGSPLGGQTVPAVVSGAHCPVTLCADHQAGVAAVS